MTIPEILPVRHQRSLYRPEGHYLGGEGHYLRGEGHYFRNDGHRVSKVR
jgi:hypothetical protein